MERHASVGTEANHITRIGRDLGLVEYDVKQREGSGELSPGDLLKKMYVLSRAHNGYWCIYTLNLPHCFRDDPHLAKAMAVSRQIYHSRAW